MQIKSDTTQEERVLAELMKAQGCWINGQYFLKEMMLSQYHRALWNLMHKRERYGYEGVIEVSDFKNEFGFKSYRLIEEVKQEEGYVDTSNIKVSSDTLDKPCTSSSPFKFREVTELKQEGLPIKLAQQVYF